MSSLFCLQHAQETHVWKEVSLWCREITALPQCLPSFLPRLKSCSVAFLTPWHLRVSTELSPRIANQDGQGSQAAMGGCHCGCLCRWTQTGLSAFKTTNICLALKHKVWSMVLASVRLEWWEEGSVPKNKYCWTVAVVSGGMHSETICLCSQSKIWSIRLAGKNSGSKHKDRDLLLSFSQVLEHSIFPRPKRHYGETPFCDAAMFFVPNTKPR